MPGWCWGKIRSRNAGLKTCVSGLISLGMFASLLKSIMPHIMASAGEVAPMNGFLLEEWSRFEGLPVDTPETEINRVFWTWLRRRRVLAMNEWLGVRDDRSLRIVSMRTWSHHLLQMHGAEIVMRWFSLR